jgi:tRNA threonylcarbamoyl adenosine modification protein YjeE
MRLQSKSDPDTREIGRRLGEKLKPGDVVCLFGDPPVPFYHIDLYRVTADEVADLGLYEYFGADGICVIEWAERAENEIPENSIKVKLIYTEDDCRDIELTGVTI